MATKKASKKTAPKPEPTKSVVKKVKDAVKKVAAKVVDSPPPSKETIIVAPDPIESFDQLISLAWDEARGSDPPLSAVAPDYVNVLRAHAESALNSSSILGGDTQLARFEQIIVKLKSRYKGE